MNDNEAGRVISDIHVEDNVLSFIDYLSSEDWAFLRSSLAVFRAGCLP